MTETAEVKLPDGRVATVSGPTREAVLNRVQFLREQQPPELSKQDQIGRTMFPGVFELSQGVVSGAQNAFSGARQLFNFDDDAVQSEEASNIARRDARVDALGPVAKVGSFVGEVAPSSVLPGGPTGSLAKRVAGGLLTDTASTLADPVREDQTRVGNIATTAAFSGASRSVGGVVSGGFRRLQSARSGDIPNKAIKDLVKSADQNEISLFLDDASKSVLAKKASVAAEVFGVFGTGAGRRRQGNEALQAAEKWLERVSADVDNYDEIVQEGLQRKLGDFRRRASQKYARVGRDIGEDAGAVTTKSFDAAADAGLAAESARGPRSNAAVVRLLSKFRDSPRGTFDEMIEFRSDLNNEIRGFLEDNKQLGKTSLDAIKTVQKALDADMAAFARSHGAESSWRAANDFYRNTVVQFKKGKLKQLTNEDSAANFDEQAAWKYLVSQSSNDKRAQNMWRALDRRGRSAVRFGLIKEALESATIDGRPFSPARFASSLEKRLPVANQFFRGRSGDEIRGLINVMRHIERAGQFAENPPTGQRAIPFLLFGGVAFEPTAVVAATASGLGIKQLFQTPTGRNLLLGANKATPGSQAFSEIVEKMERVVARGSNQQQSRSQQQTRAPAQETL